MKRQTQQRLQAKQPATFKPTLSVIAASVALALTHAPAMSETISGAVNTTQDVAAGDDFTVTANGSIKVAESETDPNAIAVEIAADYSGIFVNQGAINATASASSGTANATAVNFSGANNGGEIVNSGTITATAAGGTTGADVGAVARGIYIQDGLTAGSIFTGTGNVVINATGGETNSVAENISTGVESTYGIFVKGQISNSSFTQSGDVGLTAVGGSRLEVDDSSAITRIKEVAGIRLSTSGIWNSTIQFNGNVNVDVQAGSAGSENFTESSLREVAGIRFDGVYGQSSVSNSGNISVKGQAGDGAGDGDSDLKVEDVGAIYSKSISFASNVDNSGHLSVVVKGGNKAVDSQGQKNTFVENVAGILIDSSNISQGSTLSNRGDVAVVAQSGAGNGNASVKYVGGIQILDGGVDSGSALINSGDILVKATSTAGGSKANTQLISGISLIFDRSGGGLLGRVLDDDVVDYAELVNSGNITVNTQAGTSTDLFNADASALNTAGIWIGDAIKSGHLQNSGDFHVASQGGSAIGESDGSANASASAFGIRVARKLESTSILQNTGSTFSNTGHMLVTATGGTAVASGEGTATATASAYGLSVHDAVTEDSALFNSGNITALATAGTATGVNSSQEANAYAIYVDSITKTIFNEGSEVVTSGSFTNTGNLTGRSFGDIGIGAGLYVNRAMDGDVTLQGVIKGVGPTQSKEDSYAIYFDSGNGSLAVNAPTLFVGSLTLADQNVTLTSGKSHSVHWKFDKGEDYDLIDGDGVPWFSRNGNTQSGEYATYDPSGQALQDQVVASVASFGDHHMNRHLRAQTASQGKAQSVWAYVGHSHNDFDGKASAVNDFDVRSTGVVGGLVMNTEDDLTLGLMGGAVATKGQADGAHITTQKLDASSAFAGASLGKNLDGLMLQGGLKLGYTDMESTRLVNHNLAIPQEGLERAKGDFSAKWTETSVGASYTWALSNGLSITPSAHVSYVRAKLGGYNESGATANASLGGRSLRLMNTDLGVQLTKQLDNSVLRGSLAYVSTKARGPATVNVGLIGDTQAVALQRASYSAPKLGLGYTYTPQNNLTVNLDGSALLGGSYKGADISARLNWKF